MLDEGFQFAEYGKKNGSNTIFTKWAGDGKDYSRIVFKENEAYVFLVYGECTMFHGAFFPSMYPKGSIPKPPLMYPLGAPAEEQHEMAMVKWPVFDKEQPQQNEELQQERGDHRKSS
ncbi:expressed unknown protein [Seminavis robusta]|uniref:Uncharacterized protein n=1 Tax=Seminavis robusta TaxID=568900 RepID=A0A9N8ERJ7_9STRA|nr:expressed unknown protein [Seminavis robusta]|eukprot:Sro1410_g270320.1 n/a (117) ;mRNA; r:21257-21607